MPNRLSRHRPGARRERLESYIKRLQDLEQLCRSHKGVERAFAVQAGREVRVMVEHKTISDEMAVMLSKEIAKQVEDELTYPGQIKIAVIRETRATDVARTGDSGGVLYRGGSGRARNRCGWPGSARLAQVRRAVHYRGVRAPALHGGQYVQLVLGKFL